jgi:predicted nucleic acid-binding protein
VGLILDTNVFILAEKGEVAFEPGRWVEHGDAFISAITVSELLVGVHRANTEARRARREAFVERILGAIPALDVTSDVARLHAELIARLPTGVTIGAHDALIGATALFHGHAVLTDNLRDFQKLAGLEVVPLRG